MKINQSHHSFFSSSLLLVACGVFCLSLSAQGDDKAAAGKVDSESIYARLGGAPALDTAVDLFYEKVLADDRVNHFFEDVNMTRQISRQKAFLTAALGGPNEYEGKDMRSAHKNLDLTEADFTAIAENLQATLDDLKIDKELQGEVMAIVGSTKDAVLNRGKGKSKSKAKAKAKSAPEASK